MPRAPSNKAPIDITVGSGQRFTGSSPTPRRRAGKSARQVQRSGGLDDERESARGLFRVASNGVADHGVGALPGCVRVRLGPTDDVIDALFVEPARTRRL